MKGSRKITQNKDNTVEGFMTYSIEWWVFSKQPEGSLLDKAVEFPDLSMKGARKMINVTTGRSGRMFFFKKLTTNSISS